jgi:hypothetical protein
MSRSFPVLDVLAHNPDLVVWQLGTNDVAWGGSAEGLEEQVVAGVRALKSSGADVILMDQQYTPQVLASSQYSRIQTLIADVARQERVGRFSRFELMRRSIEAGLSPGALVSWDGLHNSAAGYECVGRALARAILRSAKVQITALPLDEELMPPVKQAIAASLRTQPGARLCVGPRFRSSPCSNWGTALLSAAFLKRLPFPGTRQAA